MRLLGVDFPINRLRQVQTAPGLPILMVASIGRSGSTLVHDGLVAAMQARRFGRIRRREARHVARGAWEIGATEFEGGHVYKTHDYPGPLADAREVRTVFTFAPASDVVLSVHRCGDVYGKAWVAEHLEHLHAPGRFPDFADEDVLGLRAQMRAWTGHEASPVLCVRYEALWDSLDAIRDFTGLPDFDLPKRHPRAPKLAAPDVVARIAETYAPLDAAIARLPDAFHPGPEHAHHFAEAPARRRA